MNSLTSALARGALALAAFGLLAGCARVHDTPEQAVADVCSALGPLAATGKVKHGPGTGVALGAATAVGVGFGMAGMAGMAARDALRAPDPADCARANEAAYAALTTEAVQPITWSSPTGSTGTFARAGEAFDLKGWQCRRLSATMDLHDRELIQGDVGTFCRVPDGRWGRIAAPTVYR